MQSKADLMHFSMELAKKLDVWYKSPPLPVDLTIASGNLNDALNRSTEIQPLINPDADGGNSSATKHAPPVDLKELQSQFRPQLDWQR